MDRMEKYFVKEVNRSLWHYTGIDSLVGIDDSNSLWASNVYFLNDSAEIAYACEEFQKILKERGEREKAGSPERMLLEIAFDWTNSLRFSMYNLFIFSLSEESSLLSQWRSYTPHGKGVSIGFSATTINELAKNSELKIAKCLYIREEQRALLNDLVNQLLEDLKKENVHTQPTLGYPQRPYNDFLERQRGTILQLLAIIKHYAFEEEGEWRLISKYFASYATPIIKYRPGASMLIPYIEIPLSDDRPIFTEIILGPSQHQNLSMEALSQYLSNRKLCNHTTNCTIPYREW